MKLPQFKQVNKVFIGLVFYLISSIRVLHAQEAKGPKELNLIHQVVYLKNGSIIRGTIIDLKKDTMVKIRTVGRNVWVFQYSEILKISSEAASFKAKTSGFYIVGAFGAGPNVGPRYIPYFGTNSLYREPEPNYEGAFANFAVGHRINRNFDIGGFVNFSGYTTTDAFTSIGIDIRGDFSDTKITPYYVAQVGIGDCNNPYEGYSYRPGLMVHPALGLKFNFKGFALLGEIGFEYQQLADNHIFDNKTVNEMYNYQNVSFKLGIMF
jgi:hypothetical protein